VAGDFKSNHRIIVNGRVLGDHHQAVTGRPVVRFAVGAVGQMADVHVSTNAGVLIDDGLEALKLLDQTGLLP